MADEFFQFRITGLQECVKNLTDLGQPKIMARIIGNSLRAGAQFPLLAARANARSAQTRGGHGLGYQGFVKRQDGKGEYLRYGRIPKALKVNRVYMPMGHPRGTNYRVNITARGQRLPGIYLNKAPHAHLLNWGWKHKGSGKHIGGLFFMEAAINTTAGKVNDAFAARMQGQIDGLKFPVTGAGP